MPHDEYDHLRESADEAHQSTTDEKERKRQVGLDYRAKNTHPLLRKPNRITVSGGAEPKPPTKMVVSGDEVLDKKKI